MNEIEELRLNLEKFNNERDWEQFHSPKNVAMALSVEAGEIVEIFQWTGEEESYKLEDKEMQKLGAEIGDVFLYLLLLASKFDLDLINVAKQKLEINKKKYPVDKAKGSAKKYTEFKS